jgi:uncharacterized protein (TIGR00730 family)
MVLFSKAEPRPTMMDDLEPPPDDYLPTARDDARRAKPCLDTPQTRSPSYRLAFTDTDFLLRQELRPVRLQLELMKPELELRSREIHATIVIFGSARVLEPVAAVRRREAAEAAAAAAPHEPALRRLARRARRLEELAHQYEEARRFARLVSQAKDEDGRQRYVIVTGGGPGIMEAANRGASDVSAPSIGHNIVLPHEQAPNPYITPELCFQFHYFALRKMHLMTRARALVVFPGGFGTLDELFETLCLVQTGKAGPLPILLFGESYWRQIVDFEAMVENGVVDEADVELIRFVETAEEAWQVIDAHYAQAPEADPAATGQPPPE